MRKDLNMRKGKIAAQAAHASMKVLLDVSDRQQNEERERLTDSGVLVDVDTESCHVAFKAPIDSAWGQWLTRSFTKVCVRFL